MTPLHPQLGVRVGDFRREVRDGIRIARDTGFGVIELDAVDGPVAPRELTQTGRRDLSRHVASLGLQLGALDASPRRYGYADALRGEEALDNTRRILDLAAGLGAPTVVTTIAAPPDSDDAARARLHEALGLLAGAADRTGAVLAVRCAGQSPDWLAGLIRRLGCSSLRGCGDAGDWIMRGLDPQSAAGELAGLLQWTRVRDAAPGSPQQAGHEVRPGEGALDPARLLGGLSAAGYSGPIVLARGGGDDPVGELAAARRSWAAVLDDR